MSVRDALYQAVFELGKNWMTGCELMLTAAGANPRDYVLVTQDQPDGGKDAWVQLSRDPVRPHYPMLQMRFDGKSITIRTVETGPVSPRDQGGRLDG